MSSAPRSSRGWSALAVLALAGALPTVASAAEGSVPESPGPVYAIRIAHEATAGTLKRLLDEARERLARPACQEVLDDFVASDGRSLRSHLDDVGCSPEAYLELLIFYDGRKQRRCLQGGNLAVTNVGGRVVHVCPEELRTRARRNPAWAEAAIIHEALHSLGLGENPPSSQEITAQVLRRCGR